MKDLMTSEHPDWRKFIDRLEEELSGPGDSLNCPHDESFPVARKVLEAMGNFDIKESFSYFQENGGHCDCEIVFNVDLPDEPLSDDLFLADGVDDVDDVHADDFSGGSMDDPGPGDEIGDWARPDWGD